MDSRSQNLLNPTWSWRPFGWVWNISLLPQSTSICYGQVCVLLFLYSSLHCNFAPVWRDGSLLSTPSQTCTHLKWKIPVSQTQEGTKPAPITKERETEWCKEYGTLSGPVKLSIQERLAWKGNTPSWDYSITTTVHKCFQMECTPLQILCQIY